MSSSIYGVKSSSICHVQSLPTVMFKPTLFSFPNSPPKQQQYYSMKTPLGSRHHRSLDLLFALHTLREDCCFYSKLLLFEWDKKTRDKYVMELSKLQQGRSRREQTLIQTFSGIEMNELWKGQLFCFSNRVYKLVKGFHMKVMTLSVKMAEIGETNTFLQSFRNQYIQTLSETTEVSEFMLKLTGLLRKKYEKEVMTYTNPAKVIDLLKREDSSKISRYQVLIRDEGPELFFQSHRKALSKIDIQIQKIAKQSKEQYNAFAFYLSIMDLDEDIDSREYVFQNSFAIKFSYLQDGLCEFIVSKWMRIVKDVKVRNEFNRSHIQQFRESYLQFNRKSKLLAMRNQRNTSLCLSACQKEASKTMNLTDVALNESEVVVLPCQTGKPLHENNSNKREYLFRVPKVDLRKRSTTLRPLGDHKENKEMLPKEMIVKEMVTKEMFPKKIVEMKLTEVVPQVIKNMRIRKRRALPVLREESGWSVLIPNQHPKLAICIH